MIEDKTEQLEAKLLMQQEAIARGRSTPQIVIEEPKVNVIDPKIIDEINTKIGVQQFRDELQQELVNLKFPEYKMQMYALQQKIYKMVIVLHEFVKLQMPRADETT